MLIFFYLFYFYDYVIIFFFFPICSLFQFWLEFLAIIIYRQLAWLFSFLLVLQSSEESLVLLLVLVLVLVHMIIMKQCWKSLLKMHKVRKLLLKNLSGLQQDEKSINGVNK